MSLKKSIKRQEEIESYRYVLEESFKNNEVSDVILLEFPKFTIYFKDGSFWDSFNFDAATKRVIYSMLKNKM